MFGLEKISWMQFSLFLLYITGAWYTGLFAWAWFIGKKRSRKTLFEYDDLEAVPKEELIPIGVMASDFPSEMILFASHEDLVVIIDLHEENVVDSGYPLDQFTGKNPDNSQELQKKIRIQQ